MKTVIYKQMGEYRTTKEGNYNRAIQNASKIQKWRGFTDAKSIIDYCIKYCKCNEEDFIIIDK